MYHYTYLIINLINNKVYYGVRSCECVPKNDTKYMGSGTIIKRAIEKYGIEKFTKDVDKVFKTRDEANLYEAKIVDKEYIEREDTYNLKTGGSNGFPNKETKIKMSEAQMGEKNHRYGVKASNETRKKMSIKRSGINHPLYGIARSDETKKKLRVANLGKKHTKETKLKMSIANKGKILTEETKIKISESHKNRIISSEDRMIKSMGMKGDKNPMYGKTHSKNTKNKMSKSSSKSYIVMSPFGEEYKITNLKKFCENNNLDNGTMSAVASGKRKHHKGWKCIKISNEGS